MKTLFRILGTAAAVAVTGAAIVVLDKILNQKDPLHVEEVEFPEDAEKDAEEAEKTAEAYAEAEAKEEAKAADAAAEAAEEAAPEAPAPAENAPQTQPETAEERPVYDPEAPNANPVEAGPAVAPKDENGKIDVTKISIFLRIFLFPARTELQICRFVLPDLFLIILQIYDHFHQSTQNT